jgi:hypothetical protein
MTAEELRKQAENRMSYCPAARKAFTDAASEIERLAARVTELDADSPVTPGWLRDVWGWHSWGNDSAASMGGQHLLWLQSGYVVVCGTPIGLASEFPQGRFTMLAIGLGVKTKEQDAAIGATEGGR